MTALPQSFRFARPEGMYYAYDYWLRGKWHRGHRFGENQEDADRRAIEYFQHLGGGNVMAIGRAGTKEIIWERDLSRSSSSAKEIVNGTDSTG